ncbi:Cof-type HAD-IIB family hydrolase [Enterococcus hulanensis]|uniref:Cof-type HAD-IIB family hydrolase n=1 Tax=Enterococcus hulanensis TaxID=2559929 RepID=A0ABU3EUD9_9ENTE|nr:Cof-type HAD-IIB family hydrolase [Enterococcus hulanensis]MDT2598475.1 Cof-type HAD-IIB family hydrolase [Enterococcus hulanensis]MDT2608020.1 Cof-type HAD-IIB family hydrolase [Enterococcus hulanensis]MDT2615315.1 Cof-type HAD-IIB family hydrolase [Enterococcus hulanensis]MDT2626714.1 Cof-type HAD-IIB family hydrolase [Enterococcus hulanensis]MDT2654387.1 Cof-type HAD-IIB family hydrolase [Enterococcus hulanensis]
MIKLIASDMDGTLVSNNHDISRNNVNAIKKAQDKGVEFIITTGRSYDDAYPQVVSAGIECNYLVMNGSELRNAQGEIIQSLYLEQTLVEQIVAELQQSDMYVEVYTTGGTFSPSDKETRKWAVATKINNFHPEISLEDAYQEAENHFLYQAINPIHSVHEIFENDYDVGKIISFSNNIEKIAELRISLPKKYPVNATGSFSINLEVTNPLADKGEAIKHYANSRGIYLNEIMTIGDSYNDLGMLNDSFGFTIAMGNAIDEVKKQAKYITDTNDADGVGKAIEQFL